jgi:hypothetical protein
MPILSGPIGAIESANKGYEKKSGKHNSLCHRAVGRGYDGSDLRNLEAMMNNKKPYLTEESLGVELGRLFPNSEFVHNKRIPGSKLLWLPDYRCDLLKLTVEYDGYQHYSQSKEILKDLAKDAALTALNYRIIHLNST